MPKTFNEAPYYDDFDENKNYHKIIFNPNNALQSRELTQMQSIIQEQIKKIANFTFENGAMVIPGNISYENNATCIKINPFYNGLAVSNYLEEMIDKNIVGATTNVKAVVVHIDKETETDPPVIFVSYRSGGIDADGTEHKTFIQNEVLTLEETNKSISIMNVADYSATGTLASIVQGVYYIDGFFVQNRAQTISLNKFDKFPSFIVGLNVVSSIVTASEDTSLLDNSNGFNNPVAIGADRMHIDLILSKYDYFSTLNDTKFISLLYIKDGEIQTIVNKTNLSKVGDILARRTYNESGDYIVEPFKYEMFEYRNNDRGSWISMTPYIIGDIISIIYRDNTYTLMALTNGISGTNEPQLAAGEYLDGSVKWVVTSKPNYNRGLYKPNSTETLEQHVENSNLVLVKISSGKAYIKGREIDLSVGYKTVILSKTRETKKANKFFMKPPTGQYILVREARGLPIISNINQDKRALLDHTIYNTSFVPIGSCKIRNFEYYNGGNATMNENTAGDNYFKISIFDLKLNQKYDFSKCAAYIVSQDTTFSAQIVGDVISIPDLIFAYTTGDLYHINWGFTGSDGVDLSSLIKVGDQIYTKEFNN